MKKVVKLTVVLSLLSSCVLNFPVKTFADSTATSSSLSQASTIVPEFKKILWDSPRRQGKLTHFRIPAITTTNEGHLLAVTDARYNKADDIGIRPPQQVDLLIQSSADNGVNWSSEMNLTGTYSNQNYGYGDAAIVADRYSDKVLIVNAAGSVSFPNSMKDNPIRVTKMVSQDGGETFSPPKDITEHIYNLDSSWQGLFAASGRIMQSRYVKVGEYNRLYMAILAKSELSYANKKNHVLYSDDFGETWKILGGSESPVPGGDEAKIEELPNGNVIISSRVGMGRYINMFTYDENDFQYSSGSWEDTHQYLQLSDEGNATNGEILVVYAKDTKTGQYTHLVLQSLPTINNVNRRGVGIFYKAVDKSVSTVDQYKDGWSKDNFYLVHQWSSAYSTMTIQADGKVGFLYEENINSEGFDIVYKNLDLKTITGGKYENAFTGIGSADTPYVVDTAEQLEAIESVYADEDVKWVSTVPVPSGISVTDVTYNSASITWPSLGDGYSYTLRLNGQNAGTTQETAWSFKGLQASSMNTIEISARRDGRVSLYSDPLVVKTADSIPVMPSADQLDLRFTDVTKSSATALWNTVQGATYYELVLQDGQVFTSVTNAVYLTGLGENRPYMATLTAGNLLGKSSSHSGSFQTVSASIYDVPVTNRPVVSWPVVITPVDDKSKEQEDKISVEDEAKELTNPFKDIDNAWNKDQIKELYHKGIIKGYSADEFGANHSVTRIEFAVMLVRAMGYETDQKYAGTFLDLNPNAWYMTEIASVLEYGIAQGYEHNEFKPSAEISREQAAKMMYAIIEKERVPVDISNGTEFKDHEDIAAWAKDAVYAAKAKGIISGMPDGNFEPSRGLTRAEAVSLIYNLLHVVN